MRIDICLPARFDGNLGNISRSSDPISISSSRGCLAAEKIGQNLDTEAEEGRNGYSYPSQSVRGPSIIKEIVFGISLGLFAGGLWKMNHWNNQRKTKEFYDLLERGDISVVVEED